MLWDSVAECGVLHTLMEMKLAPDSQATAFASSVFPHPAGRPSVSRRTASWPFRLSRLPSQIRCSGDCGEVGELQGFTRRPVQQHPAGGLQAHLREGVGVLDGEGDGGVQLLPHLRPPCAIEQSCRARLAGRHVTGDALPGPLGVPCRQIRRYRAATPAPAAMMCIRVLLQQAQGRAPPLLSTVLAGGLAGARLPGSPRRRR